MYMYVYVCICIQKIARGSHLLEIRVFVIERERQRVRVLAIQFSRWDPRAIFAMGWLRLVGSLKLQVSFAKEPFKKDNILQKRPVILRSLPIVVTPQTYNLASAIVARYTIYHAHFLLVMCMKYTTLYLAKIESDFCQIFNLPWTFIASNLCDIYNLQWTFCLLAIFAQCTIYHGHSLLQGGEDSQDPLSCRSFSTKEPLIIGHFCGK